VTVRVMIIVRMRCGKQMSTIVVNTFLCFLNKNMFYVFCTSTFFLLNICM